ncbi:MAG: DUF2905 domain-containing protein [Deltaproteobacteria bacterium]|nr:DUF2905 domain-containing protein [Deltaproteobacteria bacterium]
MGFMGRYLLVIGLVVTALGLLILISARFPAARIGRLPGDIYIHRGNFRIYVPLATSLLLSLLLSLVAWLVHKR